MEQFQSVVEALQAGKLPDSSEAIHVYEKSFEKKDNAFVVMAKSDTTKYLVAAGAGPLFDALQGDAVENGKVCPLTHENSKILNQFFDYTKPQAKLRLCGDRLGIAWTY